VLRVHIPLRWILWENWCWIMRGPSGRHPRKICDSTVIAKFINPLINQPSVAITKTSRTREKTLFIIRPLPDRVGLPWDIETRANRFYDTVRRVCVKPTDIVNEVYITKQLDGLYIMDTASSFLRKCLPADDGGSTYLLLREHVDIFIAKFSHETLHWTSSIKFTIF
jgi:hypothetical protein